MQKAISGAQVARKFNFFRQAWAPSKCVLHFNIAKYKFMLEIFKKNTLLLCSPQKSPAQYAANYL